MQWYRLLTDPSRPDHLWRVLWYGWLLGLLLAFPLLMLTWSLDALWPVYLAASLPILAHLIILHRACNSLKHRTLPLSARGPTLITLSYLPGALLCLIFMKPSLAFTAPLWGVFLLPITFGLFLTAGAPLLAFLLTWLLLRKQTTPMRTLTATAILSAGWLVSGLTGFLTSAA